MSVEQNVALVKNHFDALDARNWEAAMESLSDDIAFTFQAETPLSRTANRKTEMGVPVVQTLAYVYTVRDGEIRRIGCWVGDEREKALAAAGLGDG